VKNTSDISGSEGAEYGGNVFCFGAQCCFTALITEAGNASGMLGIFCQNVRGKNPEDKHLENYKAV
jgi:hypothetical protein